MISGIMKVEADCSSRDLDYSGYHKKPNAITVLFNIHCFSMENIQKLLCEIPIQGQTQQAVASLETI